LFQATILAGSAGQRLLEDGGRLGVAAEHGERVGLVE
jgi:hypothetical protein